jgi:hypothetical protein
MLIGQPIGLQHLVDEAVEIAEIAIVAAQGLVHAHVVNAECLLTHALVQNKRDAHFVNIIQLQ